MTIDIKVGETYEARGGHKILVLCDDLKYPNGGKDDNDGPFGVKIITNTGSTRLSTLFPGGTYYPESRGKPNDWDVIGPWVEPVYGYFPVLKSGAMIIGAFGTKDEALNAGAKEATAENPILGIGVIEKNKSSFEFQKIGE